MTDCLVVEEFSDAIREGDGERIIQMWKFLLLYFRAAHRTKYVLEALTLLVQVQALFPATTTYLPKAKHPTHPIPANWSTEFFSFDLDNSDSDM